MRNLIIAVCLVMLVGCADAHKVIPDAKYAQTRLSAEGTAYIALPADGSYGKIDYEGSGAMVAQMIQAALLDYMVQVDIGQRQLLVRHAGYVLRRLEGSLTVDAGD